MPGIVHVLAYDIHDHRRRRRMAKLMEGRATRVQESVFETCQTKKQVMELIRDSLPFLVPSEGDSLRVYRVCADCMRHFQTVGGERIDWESALILH